MTTVPGEGGVPRRRAHAAAPGPSAPFSGETEPDEPESPAAALVLVRVAARAGVLGLGMAVAYWTLYSGLFVTMSYSETWPIVGASRLSQATFLVVPATLVELLAARRRPTAAGQALAALATLVSGTVAVLLSVTAHEYMEKLWSTFSARASFDTIEGSLRYLVDGGSPFFWAFSVATALPFPLVVLGRLRGFSLPGQIALTVFGAGVPSLVAFYLLREYPPQCMVKLVGYDLLAPAAFALGDAVERRVLGRGAGASGAAPPVAPAGASPPAAGGF